MPGNLTSYKKKTMSTRKKAITDLISKFSWNELSEEERVLLENWKKAGRSNDTVNRSIRDLHTRSSWRVPYNSADQEAIWKTLHANAMMMKANGQAAPEQIMVMSKTFKRILIAMLIVAVICISGIFYITVTAMKNNKYPLKTIQRHNFRLR
jgi:hypothetical protein